MRISRTVSLLLVSSIAMVGCATKNYGRMEPLAADAVPADCAALDAQVTEAEKFRAQVAHTSEFSGADVLAFLIDFGIGNAIEKSAALKTADEREERLRAKQAQLGCPKGLERARTNQPTGDAPRHTADMKGVND